MSELSDLVEALAPYAGDPLGFVRFVFPWGEGELSSSPGPEPWQAALLQRVGDGLSPHEAVLEAVASGHGVGKSSLVAWLVLWAMSTATDTRGVVTANTENQLKTKTWVELAKWYRLCLARPLFRMEATALFSVDPERARTWRTDMVAWSERNPEAVAGLHNQGRRVFVIFDEASAIPAIIWETASGFLSDADTERLWFVFGNPTKSTGRFRECFTDHSLWRTTQVDARSISFTNKGQFEAWARSYGEDSDYYRIRVRGVFPRSGESEFISAALVAEAQAREAVSQRFDPLIIGVDVARFGDDESVIAVRKGRDARSIPAVRLRGLDTMQLASRVIEVATALRADAVFIDGGGVGGGVIDRCRQLRLSVFEVQFGSKADRSDLLSQGERYANKRAEMWGAMRAWLQTGAIEDSQDLRDQLVGPTYGFDSQDRIQLERKQDMRARGVASPDCADALCLVAGTLIATPTGDVPIERLRVGDEVLTPFGTSMIGKTWESKTERLTTVQFCDGSRLEGKPNHKIFVNGHGAVPLDALALTMEVSPLSDRHRWLSVNLLSTAARNIGFKGLVDISSRARLSTASGVCIVGFGLSAMARYRRTIMSITGTAIGATTRLRTWNCFLRPSTGNGILPSGAPAQSNRSASTGISSWLRSRRRSGMPLQRAARGIESMPEQFGMIGSRAAASARDAVRRSGLTFHLGQDSAPFPVSKQTPIAGILPLFGRAIGAASSLWRTATGRPRVVPVRVTTASVLPTSVYNLTLCRDNAYYANGVLVFNCLTFAHPVVPNLDAGGEFPHKPLVEWEYDPFESHRLVA